MLISYTEFVIFQFDHRQADDKYINKNIKLMSAYHLMSIRKSEIINSNEKNRSNFCQWKYN